MLTGCLRVVAGFVALFVGFIVLCAVVGSNAQKSVQASSPVPVETAAAPPAPAEKPHATSVPTRKHRRHHRLGHQPAAPVDPDADPEASLATFHLIRIARWTVGDFGMVEIHGTAVNNTGRDISYGQISFRLLDRDGAQVGTAMANVANLSSGSRWRFNATGVGEGAYRLEVGEITGF